MKENGNTESQLHSPYISYKNPIQNRLGLDYGVRSNYYAETNKFYIEPRLRVAYQLKDFLSIHANYDKHHQYIRQVTEFRASEFGINTAIWTLAENKSIPIQSATQWQLGFILSKNNWVVDLQAYTKNVVGISSRGYDFQTYESENPTVGDAYIKGLDLFVKKRVNKDLKIWASLHFLK